MNTLAHGIDIGGTKIAAGLVNRAGNVVRRVEAPTPASLGGVDIVDRAIELARGLRAGDHVVAVEISISTFVGHHLQGPFAGHERVQRGAENPFGT